MSYRCDGDGNCVCAGGCDRTSSDGFLLPDAAADIYNTLKEMFPEIPIDPMGPLIITYPKMRLWQFAYILSAASGRELYFPASRALDEVPAFHKFESTYADVLKEFGLERPGD